MGVAVAGYITNDAGEVLLVRTYWREDTWELPGGQVEDGEPLHVALQREVLEETGIEAEIAGVTGVYQNVGRGIVTVVFRGQAVGGALRTSDETQEVGFFAVETAVSMITRPHFRSRLLDAMSGANAPCEEFQVRPYELIKRLR